MSVRLTNQRRRIVGVRFGSYSRDASRTCFVLSRATCQTRERYCTRTCASSRVGERHYTRPSASCAPRTREAIDGDAHSRSKNRVSSCGRRFMASVGRGVGQMDCAESKKKLPAQKNLSQACRRAIRRAASAYDRHGVLATSCAVRLVSWRSVIHAASTTCMSRATTRGCRVIHRLQRFFWCGTGATPYPEIDTFCIRSRCHRESGRVDCLQMRTGQMNK